ncbi:MAG: Arc family DNA binding domain-containing protein [Candidatus Omnitrophica bacterium]|nr:Arc family DNA binding domain-containing protein [Candidatus Omnitrophota bacterium]
MSLKKKFLLRINPDLWEEINRWADEELRSVNGQIEYLLKRAVAKRKREKSSEECEGEDMAP